ncbi:beta-glucosidase BglX [Saccharicrinis sp. FJH54]|uniref:beta-glucosidase BglX n=1 Tax=Saccharicrinis sp. FJH54 TaxID=3344665 RepID=UPI0035D4B47A
MRKLICALLVLPVLTVITVKAQQPDYDRKVDSLLSVMTLEEKIGQMNQYNGFWDVTGPVPTEKSTKEKYDNIISGKVGSVLNVLGTKEVRKLQELVVTKSRLGIPLVFGFDVIHGYRTLTPIPLGEAASWDLDAIEKSARIAALEASAAGQNWTFAPMVDVSRDARWGRVMEGAGEDPYLGSLIAKARVRGFQGEDLSSSGTIMACAKHYAGYGFAESGKDYNTVDVGTSTIFNVILPPFRAAEEAGVKTFMNSFNELNGVPATGNNFLLRTILKGEWDFDGFVVSDWGSISEMKAHGFVKDNREAAEKAVKAGCDMDMESYAYITYLKDLVESGQVDVKLIDDAVKRILHAKFELGLFDDPYKYCNAEREKKIIGQESNRKAALDMSRKSMVLLKNDELLLPLNKEGVKIALIGPLADDKDSPLGNWGGAVVRNSAISVLEGMERYTGNQLRFSKGIQLVSNEPAFAAGISINATDTSMMSEAVSLAREADIVVMVLGEHGMQSGEGRSRAFLGLPGLQQQLMEAVYAVNPNIVLVLMNGRPLAIRWAAENIPSILEAWQPGSMGGQAIAEILYGDYNPSGKLPMSFPRSVGQVPLYYNHKSTGRPGPKKDVYWSHYIDQSNDPLFPFGFGLSYTDFKYTNLQVKATSTPEVFVSVVIQNTGEMSGEEVVQLYIRDEVASVTRPVKELKGFKKVMLKAGESRKISFILTKNELGFYNNEGEFIFEPGDFEIWVGPSSADGLHTSLFVDRLDD